MLIELVVSAALVLSGTLDGSAAPRPSSDTAEQEPAQQAPGGQEAKAEKKTKKKKAAEDEPPPPDEDVDPEAPVEPEPAGTKRGAELSWKQHPSLRFGSIFRLDFEAKFQEDGRSSYTGAELTGLETWELHRNRIGITGNLFKHIEYEIEHELTEKELTEKDVLLGLTPSSQWKDVNVNLTFVKNAQIQVGKFKVPFGLDQLTGVTHNDYVYRSLGANYLDPGRDIGGQIHGSFYRHGLTYATGVFRHDGDNARSKKIQGGDETFAGRVTGTLLRPMNPALGGLEFGIAFATSALADDSFRPNGLRGRTVMTQDTFYDTVYVKGHRRRWEADVDWTGGSASARAEYTWVTDDRLGQGIGDQDLPDARARAWYVSGTWILTGEDKKRPVRAARPLFQGGVGAIELAGRYERLWFDSVGGTDVPFRNPRSETIYASGNRVLTLGLNWTLTRFSKVQFNAIREHIEDPDRSPVPNGAAFWSRVLRLQFVL